jgi:hypothetical protein
MTDIVDRCLSANALFIVGIDGCGGAGKSQLATELRAALASRGRDISVVWMDDFYFPSPRRNGILAHDAVGSAFDWQRLRDEVLTPLRRGNRRATSGTTGRVMRSPSGAMFHTALGSSRECMRRASSWNSSMISPFGWSVRDPYGWPGGSNGTEKLRAANGKKSGCLPRTDTSMSSHPTLGLLWSIQRRESRRPFDLGRRSPSAAG